MATSSSSNLSDMIRQSPPVDLSKPYEAAWVKGKTIVITGGASGFGAGFVRHWAKYRAAIIIGDVNVEKGGALALEVQKETGNQHVHFVHCDVTDWQSQVNFFKEAVKLSPHGGIDTVVANAGIAGDDPLQRPTGLNTAEPPKPDFKIMDVNCTGVMYTTHLALYWLFRNPGSTACSMDSHPLYTRDRHLLFLGSVASLGPIPVQPQYGAAKHAVLGLFRSLRATSHMQGVRVNLLCPYFIDTPIVTAAARVALAGGAMGKVEDVVDAATRFVADSRILGRALVIGPKVNVKQHEDGEWKLVTKDAPGSRQTAIWEAYADDWEEADAFCRNIIGVLNAVQAARGWIGWAVDVVKAVGYSVGLAR
ncbi:NAD(P)-binding protein [Lindgomyces ingoldianus]|uniref:NAD(P)-binding protein n=1 Tax=Lindgomyces ingoldianus TaxID=673940 RepID=A0ACB6RCQ4_9PLEO|nr:NAD(P)-binding protein [Lindgomyces ingoldianus]KAF2477039.1 NAD(P)-binding protein [Lindgomyces ingoldianus]